MAPDTFIKVRTTRVVNCEDWKTASIHPQPDIPEGTVLEEVEPFVNCYGHWYKVHYDGKMYYIDPKHCEAVVSCKACLGIGVVGDMNSGSLENCNKCQGTKVVPK